MRQQLIVAAVAILVLGTCSFAAVSARNVLDQYDKTLSGVQAWSMDVKISQGWANSREPQFHGPGFLHATYLRDGERRSIEAVNEVTGIQTLSFINRFFVSYYKSAVPDRKTSHAMFAKDGGKYVWLALGFTMGAEGAMEGFVGDSDPLTMTLRNCVDLHALEQPDVVDGAPCVVVAGTSRFGRCTIWCDPNAGYVARKMELIKSAQDFHRRRKISSMRLKSPSGAFMSPSRLSFTVDSFHFKTVSGSLIPTPCRLTERYDFADRSWHYRVMTVTRTNIVLRPEFKRGEFTPNLPDGTLLSNQEDLKAPYEWRNGGPVPRHANR